MEQDLRFVNTQELRDLWTISRPARNPRGWNNFAFYHGSSEALAKPAEHLEKTERHWASWCKGNLACCYDQTTTPSSLGLDHVSETSDRWPKFLGARSAKHRVHFGIQLFTVSNFELGSEVYGEALYWEENYHRRVTTRKHSQWLGIHHRRGSFFSVWRPPDIHCWNFSCWGCTGIFAEWRWNRWFQRRKFGGCNLFRGGENVTKMREEKGDNHHQKKVPSTKSKPAK